MIFEKGIILGGTNWILIKIEPPLSKSYYFSLFSPSNNFVIFIFNFGFLSFLEIIYLSVKYISKTSDKIDLTSKLKYYDFFSILFPFDSIFKFNSLVFSFWKSPYIADIIINLLSEPSMRRAYSNNKGMINLAKNLLSFSFLYSITNLSLFLSVIINEKDSLSFYFL